MKNERARTPEFFPEREVSAPPQVPMQGLPIRRWR